MSRGTIYKNVVTRLDDAPESAKQMIKGLRVREGEEDKRCSIYLIQRHDKFFLRDLFIRKIDKGS
jgi:hypothetical protein